MMVLTLLTKQIDGEFTVYWKTGLRRGGELKVDLGFSWKASWYGRQ